MHWTLSDRGFLPNSDPQQRVTDRGFSVVEAVAKSMGDHVDQKRFQESISYLPDFFEWRAASLTDFIECKNHQQAERAFMLFSYFASAYIHSTDYRNRSHNSLPSQVARPLVRLATAVGRPPILSYASYCLHNWRRLDPGRPVELGNIELLQNFTQEAKQDEDWFILIHVDIEAKAADGLKAIATEFHDPGNQDAVAAGLRRLYDSLVAMNRTLARMPERCRPDVYYAKVRPYIFGFKDVTYEGCFDGVPQSFRGETGAQSSVVPAVLAALGIHHRDSLLTRHLDDMLNYMPAAHVAFIAEAKKLRLRSFLTEDPSVPRREVVDAYNACVDQVIAFRRQHFGYAVDYIERRVTNPTGTGGTPYIEWLKQLIDETAEFRLP